MRPDWAAACWSWSRVGDRRRRNRRKRGWTKRPAGAARQEIEATIASYERWVTPANVDSIIAMATEDATFMPPNEPSVVGRPAWRGWLEPLLQAGQGNQYIITGSVVAHGPIAVEHGRYTISPSRSSRPSGSS